MFKTIPNEWPGYGSPEADQREHTRIDKINRTIQKLNSYINDLDYYTIFGTFDLNRLEDDEIAILLTHIEMDITFGNYMYEILDNAHGMSWFWVLPFSILGYFSQKRQIKSFIKNKEEYLI